MPNLIDENFTEWEKMMSVSSPPAVRNAAQAVFGPAYTPMQLRVVEQVWDAAMREALMLHGKQMALAIVDPAIQPQVLEMLRLQGETLDRMEAVLRRKRATSALYTGCTACRGQCPVGCQCDCHDLRAESDGA